MAERDVASAKFASFGIDAETSRPLPDPDPSGFAKRASTDANDPAAIRRHEDAMTFGTVVEVNEEDLSSSGWGIVFAAADPRAEEIENALAPLIEHRKMQAGLQFRIFKHDQGVREGDTAEAWLERLDIGLDLVEPAKGAPYYLLLIGDLEQITAEFQYRIDLYWAVGRIHFDTLEAYQNYAANVVRYETAQSIPHRRTAAVFAPRHLGDQATEMFNEMVAAPLVATAPLNDFSWEPMLAAAATKAAFSELITGKRDCGLPALLFSGGHGMAFPPEDPLLPVTQGALVCQDWRGPGTKIEASHWFAASDLPEGGVAAGAIHLLFACYGGGYSATDTFRDRGAARRIADRPGIARLLQAMLGRADGGPLAVIAHIDRAFAYSFATLRMGEQAQGFRSVLFALMLGRRVGSALDRFSVKWASIATQIADLSRSQETGETDRKLLQLWIARDDARNYIVFGDPAVRLHPSITKSAPR
ncbi:hypothetical protein GOFOIKOB_5481 [Methylobacterium tardum]|uniref:Gingipain domain-containing protein n=1 Tax=Methylobacterium tardum TaxID=374432 RepID=A0AA37WQB3_9HYPH|nr:hypothetical protein [Methylobacterium tardum]URD36038.1 hypothetical protein M6G65_27000 [Methylobacterium tardum]GJE52410.1 hypothetical protein GOFOIKOB_5481 [Methylobacterium tardum]GLS69026.1 hypothetical protein GCM10007890_10380 [Methylobacterium tardum]